MASFHCEIKSGRKGTAAEHAAYIARERWHSKRGDLLFSGHGNLPPWTDDMPNVLWNATDLYERVNGTAYREFVIALPRELGIDQLRSLVEQMVIGLVGNKPYQYAVHAPTSSLEGEDNPHLHLMYTDRLPDEFSRPAERMFSRYNPRDPARGGCKKDHSGRSRQKVREDLVSMRKTVADIQNDHLAKDGCTTRVDHRTLKEQGNERAAERHLGQAMINRMSVEEKAAYVRRRKASNG